MDIVLRNYYLERFDKNVFPEPMSGCWIWHGMTTAAGHGAIKLPSHLVPNQSQRSFYAHRIAWEVYRGQLPSGVVVRQRCRLSLCVNPDHLFVATTRDDFWSRVDGSGGVDACWPWTGSVLKNSGYGQCNLFTEHLAHRIAWITTHGPTEFLVLHKCDNRICCNPNHLFLGTHADNSSDMVSKGRQARGQRCLHPLTQPRGERINTAVATAADVIAMREAYRSGERIVDISNRFNVSTDLVSEAVHYRTWKHLP